MKHLDLGIGLIFLVLGTTHNLVAVVAMQHAKLDTALLWFISGGISLWLIGAMNILRVYYADVAPGLRKVCLAANLVVMSFCVAYAAVSGAWRRPLGILLLATCAGAIAMSALRPHTRSAPTKQS